jgi:hypothetical protein
VAGYIWPEDAALDLYGRDIPLRITLLMRRVDGSVEIHLKPLDAAHMPFWKSVVAMVEKRQTGWEVVHSYTTGYFN